MAVRRVLQKVRWMKVKQAFSPSENPRPVEFEDLLPWHRIQNAPHFSKEGSLIGSKFKFGGIHPVFLSSFPHRSFSVSTQYQRPEGKHEEEPDEESGGTGWTTKEVLTWPNAISLGRLVLGPVLAWVIVQGYPGVAFCGMVVGGLSDWLDGYVARRTKVRSVLGSYLDPLADKVLVGSVALSMTYVGLLHHGLVALMVSRDAVLVAGAIYYRGRSLNWKWNGWGDFFKINVGGAPKLKPIFISKVNTALQVVLISAALLEPVSNSVDLESTVWFLSWSVGATTVGSWVWYAVLYFWKPEALSSALGKAMSEKLQSVSRRASLKK